jgi:superfamily II DNA/RNA helicase
MNCLLNDLVDLRAGLSTIEKVVPQTIQKRAKKKDVVPSWCESTLWWQFKSIEHTLEVVDSRDEKLRRLRSLAQMTVMKSDTAQITVICQQMNLKLCRNAVEQIRESTGADVGILEYSMSQQDIAATINAFHKRTTRILFVTADVATRRGFDVTPSPGMVLLNFDYPASAQLYLFRIFKRTASFEIERQGCNQEWAEPVKVFTFFEAGFDTKHASALQFLLEAAEYEVPSRLGEIALADPSRQMCYEQAFGADPKDRQMINSKSGSKTPKGRDRKDAPAQSTKSRAKGSRSPDHGASRQLSNSSTKRQDEKSGRAWRNTSPDGQWRDTETPRASDWAHEKPGDVKILKHEKKDRWDDGTPHSTPQAASTSSGERAWRPKAHSPETMWRPASASTQASSKEDDEDELQTNFRKYLNGYRNKSPDSIMDDDGDCEEDLSAAQRQWLLDRSIRSR